MNQTFDAVILGLGGMGSAVAYHLAASGKRVLGLDQFTPPHDRGSSHGQSRIIRQAYFEDPAYVPLLLRAYELWRQLERDIGQRLLTITGGLMLGTRASRVVAGSLRSAREHNLPHELLEAGDIKKRFRQFAPEPGTVALFEKNAGALRPELAVQAHLELAARHGATLSFNEQVTAWNVSGDGVGVTTARGSYEAGQLVIAAGPWLSTLLPDLFLPLQVERQVQFWFEPTGGVYPFLPDRFPIWIWETEDGAHSYGLPALDGASGGVKFALHHGGKNPICTPETIDRNVSEEEIVAARRSITSRLPALDGRCLRAATCLYTNTPDGHFVIDRHPAHSQVWIVSACSGHGFKFCPVVGEVVADLIADRQTTPQLFRLGRFSP